MLERHHTIYSKSIRYKKYVVNYEENQYNYRKTDLGAGGTGF